MSVKGRQPGFTLVEILIALTIGLFLTAGMIQMYVSNKQTYRFSEALSRIQENGRYALALIARDMRMADFWACSRGRGVSVHLNAGCATPDASSTNAMAGTDGAAGVPDASDDISLRGAVGTGLTVEASNPASAPQLSVSGSMSDARNLLGDETDSTGDIAFVSDCSGGDLFQVTDLSPATGSRTEVTFATGSSTPPGNASATLSNPYDDAATVYAWREAQYFIQNGANGRPALWLRENRCTVSADNAREVLEGVENMQIAYGEDADGDGTVDRYVPRNNVTDMDAVVSVRINLLLASAEDNLVDQPQQISFDDYDGNVDDTFTAADRRLYQVVTATYAVRNRSLRASLPGP